jgi:outer membrane usher protein
LTTTIVLFLTTDFDLAAQDLPPPPQPAPASSEGDAELQLEVFINGISSDLIARFRREQGGALLIEPTQLRNVGIKPDAIAERADGWIEISRLPDVSYEFDEINQILRFSAQEDALATKMIDAAEPVEGDAETVEAQTGTGALLNYTLYATSGGRDWADVADFHGFSALLDARVFSPFGILSSSQIVSTGRAEQFDSTRLDTTWSYSDEGRMLTYSAGDFINGGLSWTRPTRLGGIRIERNFALRPDMVTMPLPEFSGTAAVPSTVDVYINNARRLSQAVTPGPFSIANLPVVTGSGAARVVVRDSLGRETVSETPFFASSDLLAKGLVDFSAELGFARRSYGTFSNDYDDRPVGSATLRYGLSDSVTVEGHAEGGEDFYNLGAGGVFQLGAYGVGSVAAAYSGFGEETGYQLSGSVEGELYGVHFSARTQRTFGQYNDIASVTADKNDEKLPFSQFGSSPPKAIDQITVSSPLRFDKTSLNFSLTHVEGADSERSRIVSMTANRSIGDSGNVFVTAYKDFDYDNSFGLFAGIAWSFGGDKSASLNMTDSDRGMSILADLSKSEHGEVGSYGWRLRAGGGENRIASASGSYRSSVGRLEAGVEQINDSTRGYGQMEGSIAIAGGDVFLGGRIDDAFGVVDAGAPGVEVMLENRPIGQTNRRGKILLPGLRSYGENNISLDPTNLPIDARVDQTKQIVKPSDRAGAVVDFKVETGLRSALIVLKDESGAFVEAGSSAATADGQELAVGYDGQLYMDRADTIRQVTVTLPSGVICEAEIASLTMAEGGIGQGEATCR